MTDGNTQVRSYKAYLFDLYGTLADIHTDERKLSFWKKQVEVFRSYRAVYEAKELRTLYFDEIARLEKEKHKEGHEIEIDLGEVFIELLKKKDVSANEEKIRRIAGSFREASRTHLRAYAHARELLQKLHEQGKKVFLLSNAQSLFTMDELKELGFTDLFDDILISSDFGYKKPDPIIFTILLKRNCLSPEDCLMIGNDLYSDVLGARRAGIDSYYIRSALSSKGSVGIRADYDQEGMDLQRLMKRICG